MISLTCIYETIIYLHAFIAAHTAITQQPALLKIIHETINFRSSSTNNQYSYIANNSNFRGPNSLPLQSTSTQSSESNQTPCTRFNHSGNCAKPPCRLVTVPNHNVGLPISATNVIDLDTVALPTPVLHSDLKPANPLLTKVLTPINITNFSNALHHHPDLVTYLIDGLTNGFSIGYNNVTHSPTRPKNLLSATEHPTEVTEALCKELNCGHTSGPFSVTPWLDLHCSPLGSREKKDGSHRLIMDLSQPRGSSINNGIAKEDFNVQYTHFDSATEMVYNHNIMSKIDIKLTPCSILAFHLGYVLHLPYSTDLQMRYVGSYRIYTTY